MRSLVSVMAITLVVLLATLVPSARADEVRVAVASNFTQTFSKLAAQYQQRSGHEVVTIPGSTGRLYAQICNGAPFDVFLAADTLRPSDLEVKGRCVPDTRFTYARGSLVLWTPDANIPEVGGAILAQPQQRIAIANPQLAPYGRAALEVLASLDLSDRLGAQLVRGENVAQAFQFVHSGNATLGFVSRAQVVQLAADKKGSTWLIPAEHFAPIEQQAVLLRDFAASRGLLEFLTSPQALRIMRADGYDTP